MWVWVQAIAIPHQQVESVERGTPRGNLSDLYPRWLGARELLLHHRDPYSVDITREIQTGYYGRALDPMRPNDPKDQQAFAYPVYVVFLLAPTVTLPFTAVHRIAFWLFAVLTAVTVPLWLRTLGWRLSKTAVAILILLTLSCLPSIQGLKLQQLSVLVAALIAVAMYALSRAHYATAGVLLALATIKPQLVFLLMSWLCIWIAGNLRERQRLLLSFAASILILVLTGQFLLPGWITEFRTAMQNYYQYTGGGKSVLDIVLSPMWGRVISVFLVGLLFVLGWRNRRITERSRMFQWSLCFVLATTLLVIPTFALYNQLLLLPGVIMALRAILKLWQKSRFSRFFCCVATLSISWPFLSAGCLVIAMAFLPRTIIQRAWGVPFYPSFAIPITIYALLLASRNVMTDHAATGPGEKVVPAFSADVDPADLPAEDL
jgi:hypothetical protein